MVDMSSWLSDQRHQLVKSIAQKNEQYIIDFFGSVEAAQEFAHLYTIEEVVDYKTTEDSVLITTTFRLVPRPSHPASSENESEEV